MQLKYRTINIVYLFYLKDFVLKKIFIRIDGILQIDRNLNISLCVKNVNECGLRNKLENNNH